MLRLIKPERLRAGDKVATVSLSWGGAGDANMLWRYRYGVSRLEREFGLQVVAMPNSMRGSEYLSRHPEARAEDFMRAFADPSIKGIVSNIGGSDAVRLIPYLDYDLMRRNPKIYMGYSDATSPHFMCLHAGISSFYGTSVLTELADNVRMHAYTRDAVRRTLFEDRPIGEIVPAGEWCTSYGQWDDEAAVKRAPRAFAPNGGFELLSGHGIARGPLIGGCMEVVEMFKGTPIFPDPSAFDGAMLFFETSEDKPHPTMFTYWLRNYAAMGILKRASGILFGKPHENTHYDAYKAAIRKVVIEEEGLTELPILLNLPFGHTQPTCVLPYGAMAEIDCGRAGLRILESGVV